jgi:predicted nuclease of predicted toxin-antitoxin system
MRFLADACCDMAVVQALRAAGHEVLAIIEISPGAADRDIVQLAVADQRVLLTEDKDFGQIVHAQAAKAPGVVLLRYPATARLIIAEQVVELVRQRGDQLGNSFVVVEPGRIRILPSRT